MNIVEIPIVSSSPHFMQELDIFGETLLFEFEWIDTESFWLLHIADSTEKAVASSVKLQCDLPLFVHHNAKLPFALMLLPKGMMQTIERQNLKDGFTLVAHEII
jgi:hypothetical protein